MEIEKILVFVLVCNSRLGETQESTKDLDVPNTTDKFSLPDEFEGSGSGVLDEEDRPAKAKRLKCPYSGPGMSLLKSRDRELNCCKKIIDDYKWEWYRGGFYLQTHFEKLKLWKCPQFQSVCKAKVYARFSDYSKMVYLYHCNKTTFQETCRGSVNSALGLQPKTTWDVATANMTSSDFSLESLTDPCVQVALYGSKSGGYGYYHEIIDGLAPFCDISWCGFDAKTIEERGISSWNCMTATCRTNLVISSVVCSLLALAIILANVTVITVFTTSPKLRNSQAVYKISLAIADLLVGIFVIPTFISSLMLLYKSQMSLGEAMMNGSVNSEGTLQRKPGGRFYQRFSLEYLDFVGFFTILSLVVSIYTLMLASCDRFMAIHQPLRYGRHNAKRIAIWASLILWVIAILFSAMPYLVPEMRYGLVASIMVASYGEIALFSYAVIICLPLLFVWVSTLATYISTKRHARRRQTLTVRRSNSGGSSPISNMETRLARTLASMVGIFTLSLLPTAIVLIVPFFLSDIYHSQPDVFSPSASKTSISFEFVAILILMTNSLWNCFIYNARSEDFKSTAKKLYRRLLIKLGVGYVWGKTRQWASSTFRSGRTSNSAANSIRNNVDTAYKQHTLRTISFEPSSSGAKSPLHINGKAFPALSTESTGNGVVNHGFEEQEIDSKQQFSAITDVETERKVEENGLHNTDRV